MTVRVMNTSSLWDDFQVASGVTGLTVGPLIFPHTGPSQGPFRWMGGGGKVLVGHNQVVKVFLETERLRLRRLEYDDLEDLVELDGDPEVMRFINGGQATPRDELENEVSPAFLGRGRRYAASASGPSKRSRPGDSLAGSTFGRRRGRHPRNRARLSAAQIRLGKGYATEGSRALIDRGSPSSASNVSSPRDGGERRVDACDGEGGSEVRADFPPALA